MKTLGLIGGMSWESTVPYYRIINETVKERLGGLSSAQLILYSVDFARIEDLQSRGEWAECGRIMADCARSLERAGADMIVICTNTMHKLVPEIERASALPVLHIADATAKCARNLGITRVALLGTRFTMCQDFMRKRLEAQGLQVMVPCETDIAIIHRIIYEELCLGVINADSRREFVRIIGQMASLGAQGVILGCTEIGLLVSQDDVGIPVFDTTPIHARAAALAAIER